MRATRRSAHPIEVAGIDLSFFRYSKSITSLIEHAIPKPLPPERRAALEAALSSPPKAGPFQPLSATVRATDRALFTELRELVPQEQVFARRILDNVIATYDWHAAVRAEQNPDVDFNAHPELGNLRDRIMAENALWHAKRTGRKIIIWSATYHVMRNAENIAAPRFERVVTMGDVLFQRLGAGVYALGMTSHHGRYGTPFSPVMTMDETPRGSLEDRLHRIGHPLLFVDFRRGRRSESLYARPLGYRPIRAVWSRVLDGMLFIDEMIPSAPAGSPRTPENN